MNKLIGIFSKAIDDPKSFEFLGPELVDQANWFFDHYWSVFQANWSEGVNKLDCAGGWGGLNKANFWKIGEKYRIRMQIVVTGGCCYGPYDNLTDWGCKGVSGVYTIDYITTNDTMYLLSGAFFGSLIALSIRRVFYNDMNE